MLFNHNHWKFFQHTLIATAVFMLISNTSYQRSIHFKSNPMTVSTCATLRVCPSMYEEHRAEAIFQSCF